MWYTSALLDLDLPSISSGPSFRLFSSSSSPLLSLPSIDPRCDNAMDLPRDEKKGHGPILDDNLQGLSADDLVNASGHVQELDRTFGFWAICGQAVMCDNAWAAGAGALVVSLYNGGGPGVLYGLLASTFFYAFINAGLAELSSAIPSSANVYHWVSLSPSCE